MATGETSKYGFSVKTPSFALGTTSATLASLLVLVTACSSSTDGGQGSSGGTDGASAEPVIERPTASCPVEIATYPESTAAMHVPEGTAITYNSNPPCIGNHYGVWANFTEYAKPLDEGYLVHSLEHGAVALLYKCASPTDPACAANLAELRKIRDAIPTDARCDSVTRVRVIIAPFPRLDRPVAAAAWGKTYKADCVDVPTLTKFANDNYAKSPEDICASGRAF